MIDGIIKYVGIKVFTALETYRVFIGEPSDSGVVVSGPVVSQSRFRIIISASVLKWVGECTGGSGESAERVVGVGVD